MLDERQKSSLATMKMRCGQKVFLDSCWVILHTLWSTGSSSTSSWFITLDVSKTPQDSLKHKTLQKKQLVQCGNSANPMHCLPWLYKVYDSRWLEDLPATTFDLKQLQNLKGSVWYSKVPVGHSTLQIQRNNCVPLLASQATSVIIHYKQEWQHSCLKLEWMKSSLWVEWATEAMTMFVRTSADFHAFCDHQTGTARWWLLHFNQSTWVKIRYAHANNRVHVPCVHAHNIRTHAHGACTLS